MKQRVLVLFDFDGTITFEDSSSVFFRFLYDSKYHFFYNNYILCFRLSLLLKLKIINYLPLKKRRLQIHTSKYDDNSLFNFSENFKIKFLNKLLIPAAMEKIQWHKQQGHEIWIVSASYDFILANWARENNLNLITNKTIYNGNQRMIDNVDINFDEKLNQIKRYINLNNYNEIYAYGDSPGDLKMLEIATKPYYRYFN